MLQTKDFFLTLTSNASLKYFPENVLSSFKVLLPRTLILSTEFEWNIGLCEIQYPTSLKTTTTNPSVIIGLVKKGGDKKAKRNVARDGKKKNSRFSAPLSKEPKKNDSRQQMGDSLSGMLAGGGFHLISESPSETYPGKIYEPDEIEYHTIELDLSRSNLRSDYELISALNEALNNTEIIKSYILDNNLTEKNAFLFRYQTGIGRGSSDSGSSHLEIILNQSFSGISLVLPASLSRILGFPLTDDQVLFFPFCGSYTYLNRKFDLSANRPPFFYVYCNLVEPSLVGDTLAPILRTVILPKNDTSEHVMTACNPVNYFRLSQTSFNSVEVELRTQIGHKVPFVYGVVNLLLHMRPTPIPI